MNEAESRMIRELHQAVIGNKELGHEGLVRGFQRHDDWIRKADGRIMFILGGAFVIGFLVKYIFFSHE